MKNSFGTNLSVTLFGESHGPLIGAVLDGLPAGFAIDLDAVKADMEKEQPAVHCPPDGRKRIWSILYPASLKAGPPDLP